jgi:O2-independent ubiquinone biosynthesis accessory factor UbiT
MMSVPESPAADLRRLRGAVDAIDAALILLVALRGRLAQRLGGLKQMQALPLRCAAREREVRARVLRLGQALGVSPLAAEALASLLIAEACRRQGLDPDQGAGGPAAATLDALRPMSVPPRMSLPHPPRLLRLLPPPVRWAPLLSRVSPATWAQIFQGAAQQALAEALARGELAALEGRRLGIEISDLGLDFVVQVSAGRVLITSPQAGTPAEASVRGSCTDLLLLAGRLEDADTLFFQRRLCLSGDTELGLVARNLLDRLPWEQVPLSLRIILNRCARLARAARDAHRQAARAV